MTSQQWNEMADNFRFTANARDERAAMNADADVRKALAIAAEMAREQESVCRSAAEYFSAMGD